MTGSGRPTGDGERGLRVLIAHHRWWFPTTVSGADLANHEFASRLHRRGIPVAVLGVLPSDTARRARQHDYRADSVPVSLVAGGFAERLVEMVGRFRPSVIFTSCPEPGRGPGDVEEMVETCERLGLPVVLYVHDIEGTVPMFAGVKDRLAALVTNSRFMAGRVGELWGRNCEVVYPVPDRQVADPSLEKGPFVTFFNPLPHKGLHVAHTLVTCRASHWPFLFVEGFIDPESHGISLSRSGNLIHARRSPNVGTIYLMTRTLIVPSRWEEPFGRVALEAMANRVPVIASRTGGLVESVGDGGVLIDDFTNVEPWAEAIELLDDPAVRERTIEAGRTHVERFSSEAETDKLIRILERARRGQAPALETTI
jgi:glycosyltransferase involved in cell wall biosynthesis